MSVTNHNVEYDEYITSWQLVDDCVQGERAVKKRGDRYLPRPNPGNTSKANTTRYEQYKTRAQFVNYTGRTKRGLIGAVMRKDPEVDLPSQLEYLIEDASRNGITLFNLAKKTIGEVLETGRAGLLADYPQVEEGLTLAESQQNKAYIIHYDASAIINWHINAAGTTDLIVLRELEEIENSDFSFSIESRYRVLRLVDGMYVHEYYDNGGTLLWRAEPTKADGSRFQEIPFSWVGSEDNDETIDVAPLFDIATVNIGHYRNSADYEESSFFVGQPTPIVAGLTQSWVDQNGGNYDIGSRAAWLLPEGGSGMLLQAAPNQMPLEAMRHKEDQMVAIGARIIQESGGNETAEAARIRHSGENSMLMTIVDNVTSAYQRVIGWIGEFMGVDTEQVEFEINREFFDKTIDPQTIMAAIQLVDRGIIGKTDIRDNLRKSGVIDPSRTDEELDLDAEGDMGVDLNG